VRGEGGHRVYGPRADRPHLHARASSESAMSSIARSITFLVGIFASASHCSFSVLSLEKPKQNSYADVCGPTHMQNTRATVLRMHVADMIPTRQVVLAALAIENCKNLPKLPKGKEEYADFPPWKYLKQHH